MIIGQAYLVSPNRIIYTRSIYTFLDFLGDIGGLLDALVVISASIIGFLYSDSVAEHLVHRVFYRGPERGNSFDEPSSTHPQDDESN